MLTRLYARLGAVAGRAVSGVVTAGDIALAAAAAVVGHIEQFRRSHDGDGSLA